MELKLKKIKTRKKTNTVKFLFLIFFLLIVNRKAHEGMVKRGSRG
jgi:hypothetical protein